MGHQDKDSGILCICHGLNVLFGPTMATLILLRREFWLSWANWAGRRGNTIFSHSHEGVKVTIGPTPQSPHHCRPPPPVYPNLGPSGHDLILKAGLAGKHMQIFSCLHGKVLLPLFCQLHFTMRPWVLFCSCTIGLCLQCADSEIGYREWCFENWCYIDVRLPWGHSSSIKSWPSCLAT